MMENYDNIEITRDGNKVTRKYKLKGLLHRTDGPAVELPEGEEWWLNGKPHRDGDLPAIDYPKLKKWYKDGKLHREGNPAVIVDGCKDHWHASYDTCVNVLVSGEKYSIWFSDNNIGREDGPAIINDTTNAWSWYLNNKWHRLDGPARKIVDGTLEWYINDTKYTESEFNEKVKEINQQEVLKKLSELLIVPDANTKKVKVTVNGIDLYADSFEVSI